VTASSKLAVFAVAFGIAYCVIYVICTEVNLPLLTYHPATGDIGFLYQPPGRGPVMYWYGWMLTSLLGAGALALIATVLPEAWVQRAITFGAAFAVLYLIAYTVALAIYDRATIELDFLKDRAWSAIAALGAAMLVTVFAPAQWTQRIWPGWMWVVPLGAAVVTTYYLTPYFTR
jgi:hypothetical protein